jgi:hypothetical protein
MRKHGLKKRPEQGRFSLNFRHNKALSHLSVQFTPGETSTYFPGLRRTLDTAGQ